MQVFENEKNQSKFFANHDLNLRLSNFGESKKSFARLRRNSERERKYIQRLVVLIVFAFFDIRLLRFVNDAVGGQFALVHIEKPT